jgi:hypothetical protein
LAKQGDHSYLYSWTAKSDYDQQMFLIRQALDRVSTLKLVKIISCTNNGGLSMAGTVNVMPLVNQVDGDGQIQAHGTAFNLQYLRIQGGANAIIHDPSAGDIGLAVIADRDSSAVIANRGQANPGSSRRFHVSDGIYLGGILNNVPTQCVQFANGSLNVFSNEQVDCFVNNLHVRITQSQVILGNPNNPIFPVETTAGPSAVVLASLT